MDRIEKISGNIQVGYQFFVVTPQEPNQLLDILFGMRHYVLLLLSHASNATLAAA